MVAPAGAAAREKGEFRGSVFRPQQGVPRQVEILDRLPAQPHHAYSRLRSQSPRGSGTLAHEISLGIERIAAFPVAASPGEGDCDGGGETGSARDHLFLFLESDAVNDRRMTKEQEAGDPELSEKQPGNFETEMPPRGIEPGFQQQPRFLGIRVSGRVDLRRSLRPAGPFNPVVVSRCQEAQPADSAGSRQCPGDLRLDVAVGGPLIQPVDLDRIGGALVVGVERIRLLAVIEALDRKSRAGAQEGQP